jgi:ACT domain-containing protein
MKKTKEIEKYLAYQRKLRVLKLAKDLKNSKEAFEIFGICKSTFYSWCWGWIFPFSKKREELTPHIHYCNYY